MYTNIIVQATKEFPRITEADAILLNDGRLFLAVARKPSRGDSSPGEIIGLFSKDGGRSWRQREAVIQAPWTGITDVMSVSLLRTARGIHMFFIGRIDRPEGEHTATAIFQMISSDEGENWSTPEQITTRSGYHVLNNARVICLKSGRIIVPLAYTDGPLFERYDSQRAYCLCSDDNGHTWTGSSDVVHPEGAMMEPGVVECADGTIYMTIRTKFGYVYEARSYDAGLTWTDLAATILPSPAAPSTVVKDPHSDHLWMFWCNTPNVGLWTVRNDIAFAYSKDQGRSWSKPYQIEHSTDHSYGYVSFTNVGEHALLTYYDCDLACESASDPESRRTSLRGRLISHEWFRKTVRSL